MFTLSIFNCDISLSSVFLFNLTPSMHRRQCEQHVNRAAAALVLHLCLQRMRLATKFMSTTFQQHSEAKTQSL